MKNLKYITMSAVLAACTFAANAQSKVESAPMNFNIVQGNIPAVLDVVSGTVKFTDQNNNGVIDANESCSVTFKIKNSGKGDGKGCRAVVDYSGDKTGIAITSRNLPTIRKGEEMEVTIPIKANANTVTGSIDLEVLVTEPNGNDAEKIRLNIGTHKLETPMVAVANYTLTGEGGKLEKRRNFSLQIAVQNIDQGLAEDVMVELRLPDNINFDGGDDINMSLADLKAGESQLLTYDLRANQYAADSAYIRVIISEKTGKYSQNASIPVRFGRYVGSTISLGVDRQDHTTEITKVQLVSPVDENIPVTTVQNKNTFVMIIANETYRNVASVPYALNDGNIFRQYCISTLGIPEKNIKYLPNATLNDIRTNINWLQNITEVFDNPRVIVYYAGHGIPDESDKSAYLLPVDGSGSDISTGYKLDDLYATLGHMPTDRIAVFMDACFSGSKRENGMLASARGVALKAKAGAPQGNMVVFSAAQGDETAYPYPEEKHGLFTFFLLKKLQETKGEVTLQELSDYIITNVKQQSAYSKKQTPCVTPSSSLSPEWKNWTLLK